ncbi:MAG: hypothetical protein D6734_08810 [Candidatus Schekmanbacteria bacterium]|nr:MAG: hypothetical protein D6734_08810 [Candidatus Schekmanbacteria bacterium]
MNFKDIEKIASAVVGSLFSPRSANAGVEGCAGPQDSNPFDCSQDFFCDPVQGYGCGGQGPFTCQPAFDCPGFFDCPPPGPFDCPQLFTAGAA